MSSFENRASGDSMPRLTSAGEQSVMPLPPFDLTASEDAGPATSNSAGLLGVVYLVGAGPGAADLLTLKAHRLIQEADAIVYDYLVAPEIMALAKTHVERVFVGKKGGGFCCPQTRIEETLIRLAREGKRIVRLKGGDPFIFGRGGEEAEALATAGIPFEIVPGVTSALAAAAYAGIPLTHRAHSSAVVFLTGHEDPSKPDSAIAWEHYGRLSATLCVYMGMKNLETITRRLQAGGLARETPAAVIQSATTGNHRQLISTVGNIALESEHAGFGAPAIVVIGEVAALSDKLAWFAAQPEVIPQ
jgi:uroporphyrinogen III methyltransferase / synthase